MTHKYGLYREKWLPTDKQTEFRHIESKNPKILLNPISQNQINGVLMKQLYGIVDFDRHNALI